MVWETTLTPGSVFGGEIGSAAFVDGRLIAVSNVGNPETNFPTNVAKVFGLDPATGEIRWQAEDFPGKIFAPVGAVPGVAFVGTDTGVLAALDTATGARAVDAPTRPTRRGAGRRSSTAGCSGATGSRSSWVPGQGGVISFEVGTIAARPRSMARFARTLVVAVVIVFTAASLVEPRDRRRGRRPQTRGVPIARRRDVADEIAGDAGRHRRRR